MSRNTDQNALREELKSLLAEKFPVLAKIGYEDPLFSSQQSKLDSLQSLHLVFLLEKHFEIRFAPDELKYSNFKNIAIVSELIGKKLIKTT